MGYEVDVGSLVLPVSRHAEFPLQALAYTAEELEEAVKKPSFVILDAIVEGVPLIDDGTWEKSSRYMAK